MASPTSPLLAPSLPWKTKTFESSEPQRDSPKANLQALDQVTDCHSGWDGVGVDDDVWRDALAGEDHVLLAVLDAARTLEK